MRERERGGGSLRGLNSLPVSIHLVKMVRKAKRLRTYKFLLEYDSDSWQVGEEFIADEDMVILGFLVSGIGRGTDGAVGITKSGKVDPSVGRQDDVLYYQEIAGGAAAAHILSHNVLWFPEDTRPELDEDGRIYVWLETGQTNIQHVLMYYYEK